MGSLGAELPSGNNELSNFQRMLSNTVKLLPSSAVGTARYDTAQLGSRHGSVRLGMTRLGPAPYGSVLLSLLKFGKRQVCRLVKMNS